MNIEISRLTKENAPKLATLNLLFGDVFEDPENYTSNKPNEAYLANFLDNTDHIVLVAEVDGRVVGGLVAYVVTKFEQDRQEVFIYDLAVASDLQGQGIGKRIMASLFELSKELGAYLVFVQADEGDEAIHFYESLGPTENSHTRNFDFELL